MDFWFPFKTKLKPTVAKSAETEKRETILLSEDDIDILSYINNNCEVSRELDAQSGELLNIDPYLLATQVEYIDEMLKNLMNRSEVVVVNQDIYRLAQTASEYLDVLQEKLKEEKAAMDDGGDS